MKLGRLSLVATMALTTGLQAAEIKYDERLGVTVAQDKGYTPVKEKTSTIKFDGSLRLWYQTMDHEGAIANGAASVNGVKDKGLFARDTAMANEWGNVEAQFSVSGNVNEHLKAKGTFMAISTMGLENEMFSFQTARNGSTGALDGKSAQPFWVHEAFLDYAFDKTNSVKVGRMELDTPLIFTEKWNATANAFEALTATNTDLPNTTITAGYIAKGNGAQQNLMAAPQVFGAEGTFNEFMGYTSSVTTNYYDDGAGGITSNTGAVNPALKNDLISSRTDVTKISGGGAVVLGAVNKSIDFMPLQAWGYAVPDSAMGYWLQADPSTKNVGPLSGASLSLIAGGLGADGATEQFFKDGKGGAANTKTKMTNTVAAKVGASAGIFNAYAAASAVGKGNLPIANIGTNYKKTKLPTASIFNDGMVVAQPDTNTWKVGAGAKFEGIGTLEVSYGASTVGQNAGYQNPGINAGGPASMGYIAQNIQGKDLDVNEFDIIFNTKVKDVDIAAMYMMVNNTYVPILGPNGSPVTNGATQAGNYGELSNNIVRIVATLKF